MRVVVLGDIGSVGGMIHIGDEAMFEELARQAAHRDIQVVALSSNPTDTTDRYGVVSIHQIGFSFTGPEARDAIRARSDAVLAFASGSDSALDAGDPARAVAAAVRDADAVFVSGGGNVASNWPLHIWERLTLARLADFYGVPFALSGQTIGPRLDAVDLPAVMRLMTSARMIGVRESATRDLVHSLGIAADRVTLTVDDASFLGDAAPSSEPYCLVSLSLHVGEVPQDEFVAAVAHALDLIATELSLGIVFLPHFASTEPGAIAGDSVLHEAVRSVMRSASRALVATTATEAANLARRASLVVTSRYHPAVFAVAAGVPTVAVSVDEYTRIKLTGALGNFGQSGVIDLERESPNAISDLVREVWSARQGITDRHLSSEEKNRARSQEWWDRLFALRRAAVDGE